jgi:hypothetical protein
VRSTSDALRVGRSRAGTVKTYALRYSGTMKDGALVATGLSDASIQRLHSFYLLAHEGHRAEPKVWTLQHCNRILTSLVGGLPFSWKVVGITPLALSILKENKFVRKGGSGVTRAHIYSRAETVRILISPETPLTAVDFLKTWIENDKTVLCARGENRAVLPSYIKFPTTDVSLFLNGGVAWRHGRAERDFLSRLATDTNCEMQN